MRAVCRRVLAILAAATFSPVLQPAPVSAGAWTREAGSLQLITKIGRKQSPTRESADEDAASPANLAQIYGEYGLRDGLTVGANAWLDIAPDDLDQGSFTLGAFARQRLWQTDDGRVASTQLSVSAPAESLIADEFAQSKPFSALDFGLEALFGKSWWGDWGSAFLSTGGGYHIRFENQPDELRGEATAGVELHPCCLPLLSIYGLLPLGDGDSEAGVTVSPSFGWHVRKGSEGGLGRTTLQLGATLDALNPDDGFGAFLGLWQTF